MTEVGCIMLDQSPELSLPGGVARFLACTGFPVKDPGWSVHQVFVKEQRDLSGELVQMQVAVSTCGEIVPDCTGQPRVLADQSHHAPDQSLRIVGRICRCLGVDGQGLVQAPEKVRWQNAIDIGGYAVTLGQLQLQPLPDPEALDDDGPRNEWILACSPALAEDSSQF